MLKLLIDWVITDYRTVVESEQFEILELGIGPGTSDFALFIIFNSMLKPLFIIFLKIKINLNHLQLHIIEIKCNLVLNT